MRLKYEMILVKNEYQEEGDLVFRPLVRAYKEIGADSLIENGNAVILGVVDDNGVFYELFTGKEIDYSAHKEYAAIHRCLNSLSREKIELLVEKINSLVFNERGTKDRSSDEIRQMMEEDAKDRAIEQKAYEDGLSMVNPYDKENPNGYKDFAYKCSVLETYKKKRK